MGMHNLDYLISGLFISLGSAIVGGFFSVIAWVGVVSNLPRGGRWKVPAVLYTYSAAAFLGFAAFVVFMALPSHTPGSEALSPDAFLLCWLSFVVAGFVFVLISMLLAYRYSGPGRRFILVGSIVLIVVNGLGFVVFAYMHGNR
jgi:hypothetical protein